MKYFAIAAIVGFVVLLIIVVIIAVVVNMIKNAAKKVADKAISGAMGVGSQIANQATGRVLDVGEKELVKGIEGFKQDMVKSDPRRMATEVTKLAKKHGGELTVSKVMADMSVNRELATSTLKRLEKTEICFAKMRGEESIYIFSAFKKKRKVKICEYCDSTYNEIDKLGDDCPSCGAKLKLETVYDL